MNDEKPRKQGVDLMKSGLLSSIEVRGHTIRNRITMAPMASDVATEAGEPTEKHFKHYSMRAKSVGLMIVEHAYVTPEGKLSKTQLGIHEDGLVPLYKDLLERLKPYGATMALQITHAGNAAKSEVTGLPVYGPSPIPHPNPLYASGDEVQELTLEDLERIKIQFGKAAKRAEEAGFDAIQLHGAHGYLLNQFTSPLVNMRTDEYGGSLENRARFVLEVVRHVREVISDNTILIYRLAAADYAPSVPVPMSQKGLVIEEGVEIAEWLVAAGVDILDISGGIGGSRPKGAPAAYFLSLAEKVKERVGERAPVILTGGITEASLADAIVREGKVDFAGIGRALLTDPEWADKALEMLR